jgi:hypothetical protein
MLVRRESPLGELAKPLHNPGYLLLTILQGSTGNHYRRVRKVCPVKHQIVGYNQPILKCFSEQLVTIGVPTSSHYRRSVLVISLS